MFEERYCRARPNSGHMLAGFRSFAPAHAQRPLEAVKANRTLFAIKDVRPLTDWERPA